MKKKRKANKKKPTLKETVEKLAAIAEEHLSKLPEEERDRRVAAFSRIVVNPSRGIPATPSRNARIRVSRVAARER